MLITLVLLVAGAIGADDDPLKKPTIAGQAFLRKKTQEEIRRLEYVIQVEESRIKRGLGREGIEDVVRGHQAEVEALKSGQRAVVPILPVLSGLMPGTVGQFGKSGDDFWLEVEQIINEKEMLVCSVLVADIQLSPTGGVLRTGKNTNPKPHKTYPFLLRGRSTAGLSPGDKLDLAGCYEVIGTKRQPGAKKGVMPTPILERVEVAGAD